MGRKRYQRAFRGKLGTVKAYLHPKEAADGILDLSTLHNMLSLARPSGRLLRSANTFGANGRDRPGRNRGNKQSCSTGNPL